MSQKVSDFEAMLAKLEVSQLGFVLISTHWALGSVTPGGSGSPNARAPITANNWLGYAPAATSDQNFLR